MALEEMSWVVPEAVGTGAMVEAEGPLGAVVPFVEDMRP